MFRGRELADVWRWIARAKRKNTYAQAVGRRFIDDEDQPATRESRDVWPKGGHWVD